MAGSKLSDKEIAAKWLLWRFEQLCSSPLSQISAEEAMRLGRLQRRPNIQKLTRITNKCDELLARAEKPMRRYLDGRAKRRAGQAGE